MTIEDMVKEALEKQGKRGLAGGTVITKSLLVPAKPGASRQEIHIREIKEYRNQMIAAGIITPKEDENV